MNPLMGPRRHAKVSDPPHRPSQKESDLSAEPHLENRVSQFYVGISVTTSIVQEREVVARLLPELNAWLQSRRLTAAGAPFVRYREIEMPHKLRIEVCLPVSEPTGGDDRVTSDTLPGGRYVVLSYRGPAQGLVAANARLQDWAGQHGIRFRARENGKSSTWDSRTETYLGRPEESTEGSLEVEIAYLTS
jgi:DNA gyrase inhibitor GyrI